MNDVTFEAGPLESLLADPDVIEILIDGPHKIYVEKHGRLEDCPQQFNDEAHLLSVLQTLVKSMGRRLDESSPIVDVRFPDGSRMNVVIPPIALHGPVVTIRKFPVHPVSVEDLLRFGSWNEDMVTFLRACVQGRLNIAVGGGVGSGKTSVLNLIADMIPDDERIVVTQNAEEMRFQKKRMVVLETRPANVEGKGEISMEVLVGNARKMRPDRIIASDVSGGEAITLLQAMTTGMAGCLFALHASGVRDVLARLEVMAALGNPSMPLLVIREQMASVLNLILYQERLNDGSRKLLKIAEITAMHGEAIAIQDIFEFRQTGRGADGRTTGYFSATGNIPKALIRLRNAGIELPMSLFTPQ